jgi:hypothetical protein
MLEYIIRANDGEEFDIHSSKWSEVLRPKSYESEVIEGWGLLRLRILGCEVSFSPEPPGTQIVFECENIERSIADAIVKEIVENSEAFTGQIGVIIPLQ